MGNPRWAPLVGLAIALVGCRETPPALDPKLRAEGLYVYGTSLFFQGEFQGALEALEELKTIVPDDPRLPAAFGELYLAQGRLQDALAHYERAARLSPDRSTNWSRIGFIQTTLGRNDEARLALERAIVLNPAEALAFESLAELARRAGDLEAAVEHLSRAAEVATTPETAAELRVGAAQVLATSGRRPDAIRLLLSAWGRGSHAPVLLGELGELLVREERFDEALAVFTDAARRSREDPGLWLVVGELSAARGEPDKALEAWRASLKVKDRAVVRLAIARLHHARSDVGAGRRELDRALEIATGTDAWEMRELAKTLQLFDRKEDALAILEVLASEPDGERDVALQLETARLARDLGGRAEAIGAACARAQRADPKVTRCP